MITNNGIAFRRFSMAVTASGNVYVALTDNPPKNITGVTGYISANGQKFLSTMSASYANYGNTNNNGGFLWIGKDDTEPTVDDYALDAFAKTTEITVDNMTVSSPPTVLNGKAYVTVTAQFTAVVDITVKEVGYMCNIYQGGTTKQFLLAREVFKNTAASGETDSRFKAAGTSFSVSMTFEID